MTKLPISVEEGDPAGPEPEEEVAPGPQRRQVGEALFAVVLLVASLCVLYLSYGIYGLRGYVTPGALPLATSVVLVITMIVVVVSTLRRPAPMAKGGKESLAVLRRAVIPPLLPIMIVMIVAYALALEPLGFVVSSILFLFVLIAILQGGRVIRAALVSVLSVAVIFMIFRYGFEVLLPSGDLL